MNPTFHTDNTRGNGPAQRDAVLRRFVAACQTDKRIAAAFLGGSLASGNADAYSDLDIYVVTTAEDYAGFFSERYGFMHGLGEPVYLEDFNAFGFDMVWFTFDDGVEGELSLAPETGFTHIHGGPYKPLVDKKGLLAEKTFPLYEPTQEQQTGTLHRQIYGFWEALSHFITAMHRKQPWTAFGSLDEMRMHCLKLLRLKHDFTTEHTAYSKVEQYVPESELLPLKAACCSLDPDAMLQASLVLVQTYRRIVPGLAAEHGIEYPAAFERVMLTRLDTLSRSAEESNQGRSHS